MSELEFIVKPKVLKLTVDGKTHVGRFPRHGERKEFLEKLAGQEPQSAEKFVEDFFVGLGFPREVINGDLDDVNFVEFMNYVLSGGTKKN